MKRKAILLFLLFTLVCGREAFSDIIYLKNGNQFKGHIVRQDDERVTFSVGEEEDRVEATFFNDEILRIDKAKVSSFISLPFGEDQNIDIPRPIFEQVPVISDQVKTQKEQQAKLEASREADESDAVELEIIKPGKVETGDDDREEAGEAEAEEDADVKEEIKQADAQEEPGPRYEGNLTDNSYGQETNPQPEIKSKVFPTNSDSNFQDSMITAELSQLLDNKERSYFLRVNNMVRGITGKMANLLASPNALAQQSDSLNALVKDMPAEIEGIIVHMRSLQVPDLFINFHKIYLDNLVLMKEVFDDMSEGNIAISPVKIQSLQDTSVQLQDELKKILAIKKRKY